MTNKIIAFMVFLIFGFLVAYIFILNNKLEKLENEFDERRKKEIQLLEEQKNREFKNLIEIFSDSITDLKNQSEKIKYIPYEKAYYMDRDVDTALDVISEDSYDSRSDKEKE